MPDDERASACSLSWTMAEGRVAQWEDDTAV